MALMGLSKEEFKLELEELSSEGLKFDVKGEGGDISLSLSGCDISVYHGNDFCGEVIITKPDADVKFVIDYNALEFVFGDYNDTNLKYHLEMDDDMGMSEIIITVADIQQMVIELPNAKMELGLL